MIDPTNPYFYYAPESKLEEFLLFCVFVCNKNAVQTSAKLENFLTNVACNTVYSFVPEEQPFNYVRNLILSNQLEEKLKEVKTGQYKRIVNVLGKIVDIQKPLSEITFDELVSIKGVGLKTAAFFLTYTRKDFKLAVIDTHLLKYLAKVADPNAPRTTPQNIKLYKELSDHFLHLCDMCDINYVDADLNIWKYYSGKPDFDRTKIPFFGCYGDADGI